MHLIIIEDWDEALRMVKSVMGWWHGYYAKASRAIGARGLVLKVDGDSIGSTIYYSIKLPSLSIGVVYYVVVRREYRGRGYGKILVSSAEELMEPVDLIVATINGDNRSSISMFNSLSYKLYKWDELYEINGSLSDAIYRVTCSYEDDIVAIKTSLDISEVKFNQSDMEESMKVWDTACYRPWRRLKNRRLFV